MHIEYIPEPNLEFGSGHHVDTRFGIMNFGPLDVSLLEAPHSIRIGICGTPETVEGTVAWLDKCKSGIPAKISPRFNLFPRFPGFSSASPFRSEVILEPRNQREITQRTLNIAMAKRGDFEGLNAIIDIFMEEFNQIIETSSVDVLICAPPVELDRGIASEQGIKKSNDRTAVSIPTFHDLLKARGMSLRKPLQLIFPATYGAHVMRDQRGGRSLQDEATRAWNFFVALYYKSGGRPWRLVREPTQFSTCFVGVSFYKSYNQETMLTSMAQVFNERGHGVVVRGASPKLSKDDRHPHLMRDDAHSLLRSALFQYRSEHHTMPARIVVHKTSFFDRDEIEGFTGAMGESGIETGDLISFESSSVKLFRNGAYPPLRGIAWINDVGPCFLYTKGSVEFYSAYPGLYIPHAIQYKLDWGDDTPKAIAKEILELTKMNWNTSQFDNSEPITLHAARQVGSILKHVEEGGSIAHQYCYYM